MYPSGAEKLLRIFLFANEFVTLHKRINSYRKNFINH